MAQRAIEVSLVEALGLGERELVAFVGGGGKSTLMMGLAAEVAATGGRVLVTTTTKMGRDQADDLPTLATSVPGIPQALEGPGPVMLVTAGDDHKVTGPAPEEIDAIFAATDLDYLLVEADGSRGHPLKAPAAHEPVIPGSSTTVVILMGIDAVGRPLASVTHRAETAMRFTGLPADHVLTAADCATILTHPQGALRVTPPSARVVVALTKVRAGATAAAAAEMEERVLATGRFAGVVVIGDPR